MREKKPQAFKVPTYCESASLRKQGSWSRPLARDVGCSRACRRPSARSRAALDSVGPVDNTCFPSRALAWVSSLARTHKHTQTLKEKSQMKSYLQKQNKNPTTHHQHFSITVRHLKDLSPAQTPKMRNGPRYQTRSQVMTPLALSPLSTLQSAARPSRSRYLRQLLPP